jgi:hypothetical protein
MDTTMVEAALRALLVGDVADMDEALIEAWGGDDLEPNVYLESAVTFADAGVLSSDPGLVLRFGNGDEFQLTLVRSA